MTTNRLLSAILGAGIGLRLWALYTSLATPFWYDESFSWLVARRPLADLIAATAADVHPPLWYLLVKLVSTIQPIEAARLLPCLLSILALLAAWLVLQELALPDPARLLALAAMALSSTQIHYAVELRMYSLLTLLSLLQLYFLLRRDYRPLALTTAAALYTHNYAILWSACLFALGMLQALRRPRAIYEPGKMGEFEGTDIPHVFSAFALPGAVFLPWVSVLVKQTMFVRSGLHWVQPITWGQALGSLASIAQGLLVPGLAAPLLYMLFWAGVTLAALSSLRAKHLTLPLLALGPWLIACLGSLLSPMLIFRGLIVSSLPLYALVAAALQRSPTRWRYLGYALYACAILYPLGVELSLIANGTAKNVAYISNQNLGPGAVVHIEDATYIAYSAYTYPGTTHYYLDIGCPEPVAALGPTVRKALSYNQIEPAHLPAHYTLIAGVTGFSTLCQEDWYKSLTGYKTLAHIVEPSVSDWGIYGR